LSDVFIGRYRVIEELGRGGMGIVYRGEDPVLDRPVAIKVLPPKKLSQEQAVKRFLREARLCAKLDHPNIIKIHDIGEEEGIYHIVMEFINGRSVRDIIEERDSIVQVDVDYMLEIFLDVCEALEYAHQKKVIHRDIKPDNIMITQEGRVKVMDFGLAVLENRHSLTEMGQVMGTVAYFSPEQARGEVADQRSDIYSLGSLLYEMLTNHLIFQATNPAEMISKHLTETPRSPVEYNRAVPTVIAKMILRALKKLPEQRYQNVEEMYYVVRNYLDSKIIDHKNENDYHIVNRRMTEESPEDQEDPEDPEDVSGDNKADEKNLPEIHYGAFDSNYVPESIIEKEASSKHCIPESPDNVPSGGSFVLPGSISEKDQETNKAVNEVETVKEEEIEIEIEQEKPTQDSGGRAEDKEKVEGDQEPTEDLEQSEITNDMEVSSHDDEGTSSLNTAVEKVLGESEATSSADVPGDEEMPDDLLRPTTGESPVATSSWQQEARKERQWDNRKHTVDKIIKDQWVRDKETSKEGICIPCPRCGAENDRKHKYCRKCGNPVSEENYIAQVEAKEHNRKGLEFLSEGKKTEACSEFKEAVKKYPEFSEACMNLAKVLGETGQQKEARVYYRKAAKLKPADPEPHVAIADLYRLEHRRDDAIYEYREAVKLAPSDVNIRTQLALLYFQKGDVDRAIDEYQKILSIDPENLEAHRQLGYLYMSRGKNTDAIKEFEWVSRIDPEDAKIKNLLGMLYIKVGQLQNAENHYISILSVNPVDTDAMAALGDVYEKQNRVDLALEKFDQAIRSDTGNVEARKKIADIYIKQKREDLAISELEEAVRYNPLDPELHKNLGDLYLKTNDIDRALLHFEKTVNLSPENPELHHKLAKLYTNKAYSELSISEFKKAAELAPYNPEYREDLSMAYYSQKHYQDAIKEMKKASTLDSTNTDYQKALGIMLEESNQLDEAREQFRKVLDINPRDSMAHGMLGKVYSKQGLQKLAILQYEKALKLKPDSHLFHMYLGQAFSQQGNYEEAAEMIEKAIKIASSKTEAKTSRVVAKAYADLGKVYIEQGELEKAAEALKTSELNNPGDPKTLHYIGLLHGKRKNYHKAQQYLSRALKATPQDAEVLRNVARVYLETNNTDVALSFAQKAVTNAPLEAGGYEILAEIYAKMGLYPDAQKTLSDAIKNCSEKIDRIYWLKGRVAAENKHFEQALECYEKAIELNEKQWYYFRDIAYVYEQIRNPDEAIKALNKAMLKNPGEQEQELLRQDLQRLWKKSQQL
jgi:tetratricopeptide (TPR) repeat protein/serine/threonine protein kinase